MSITDLQTEPLLEVLQPLKETQDLTGQELMKMLTAAFPQPLALKALTKTTKQANTRRLKLNIISQSMKTNF